MHRGWVQGNLNNFASRISCEQACVAGTQPPKEVAIPGQAATPTQADLVFLASAVSPEEWVSLDTTSVRSKPLPLLVAAAHHACLKSLQLQGANLHFSVWLQPTTSQPSA